MKRIIKNFKDIFPDELNKINAFAPLEEGKKKIYFTGTGRCGTTYTSQVMKNLGFDFGHETMRKHGQSSYKITPWCAEIGSSGDAVIVRLVRDKSKTVESIIRQGYFHPGRVLYNGFIKVIPEVEQMKIYRDRVSFYYDTWYKLSKYCSDFTFNIEDLNYLDLKAILNAAGYDIAEADIRAAMMQTDYKQNSNLHKAKKFNYEKKFED